VIASRIALNGLAHGIARVREYISPHRLHAAVGSIGIAFDIEIGDQTARGPFGGGRFDHDANLRPIEGIGRYGRVLDPNVRVEISVADGFGEVFFSDRFVAGDIRDRTGDA